MKDFDRWVELLAQRQDGPEALEELAYVVEQVDRAVDVPGARQYAGPCDVCGRDLYADSGALVVECRPCGIRLDMEVRREWLLKSADDRLEGAATCARVLSAFGERVTSDLIRQWGVRGVITAYERDHLGRPLYRIGDVRRALRMSGATPARRQA